MRVRSTAGDPVFDCSESGRLYALSDLECTRWAQLGGYDRGDFCIHDGITGRDNANDECIVLTAGVGYVWDVEQVSTPACKRLPSPDCVSSSIWRCAAGHGDALELHRVHVRPDTRLGL